MRCRASKVPIGEEASTCRKNESTNEQNGAKPERQFYRHAGHSRRAPGRSSNLRWNLALCHLPARRPQLVSPHRPYASTASRPPYIVSVRVDASVSSAVVPIRSLRFRSEFLEKPKLASSASPRHRSTALSER